MEPSARRKTGALAFPARWLGFAGLAPQVILAGIVIAGPANLSPVARQVALTYAGAILSFIGGAWWGVASAAGTRARWWVWVAAVIPSLIGFAAMGAPAFGVAVSAGLIVTGISLIASLGIDYKLAQASSTPAGWLSLRTVLSLGLGCLTIAIAF